MAHNRKPQQQFGEDSLPEDDLDESLLNSPAKRVPIRTANSHARKTSSQQPNRQGNPADSQHEADLRQELVNVRKVNEAIEGVLESLEKAKSNMKNVNQTVNNASALLNIWTRILSQTEHSQRLILDPTWQGASQDIADMEDEAQAKEQAAERREAEEQEQRAAATKKAEEQEKRRLEAAAATYTKPKPATRSRGSLKRGTSTSRAGYVTMGGTSNATTNSTRGSTATRRAASGTTHGTYSRGLRGRG